MTGIIAIIVVLGSLIFFHELGHFLAARLTGVGVETFSIGFGKAIFSKKIKKTTYKLGIFPLGGYVSLVGENEENKVNEPFTIEESFGHHPAWHRLLIVIAGPLFNFILAALIYWMMFFTGTGFTMPEVGEVTPDSPAAQAGIVPGDIIKSIDGVKIGSWEEMLYLVQNSQGAVMQVEVEQSGVVVLKKLAAAKHIFKDKNGDDNEIWLMGLRASERNIKKGFFAAAARGIQETINKTEYIFNAVGRMFSGKDSVKDSLGGPLMVAQVVHNQATYAGFSSVLKLTALLSLNLGLLNLLPIPALDGGHVFFNLIEIISRRKVPEKIQAATTYAGFMLLIGLMIMATMLDLGRLFS